MRLLRSTLVALLVAPLLWVSDAVASEAAEQGTEAVLRDWDARFQQVQRDLGAGDWSDARDGAKALLDEIAPQIAGGPDIAKRLAVVVTYRAIAEAELGQDADAAWSWAVAQNLDPALRDAPLDGLGRAGELLARHRLRRLGEPPPGVSTLQAVDPTSPAAPVPIETPPATLQSGPLEVEVVVDRSGRVRAPVVVDAAEQTVPGRIVLGLEALRRWRFRPGLKPDGINGTAIRVDPSHVPSSPLYELAAHPALQPAHERALAGDWSAVADRTPISPPDHPGGCFERAGAPTECARGLAALLRSLAEMARGNAELAAWDRHVAVRFYPALAAAPLESYGPVGRELLELAATCTFGGAKAGCPPTPLWRSHPGVTPPRKIQGEAPQLPDEIAALGGDRVVLRTVIGADGHPRDTVALMGRFGATRSLARESLSSWRFEPARHRGEPVAVVVELTMPFAIDAPGERIEAWRQELDEIDHRLLAGEWSSAARLGRDMIDDLTEEPGPGRSDLLARALAGLALAEAGRGRTADALWSWHAAQNLARELAWTDLSAYGSSGELLAANPLRWPGELAARVPPPEAGESPAAAPGGDHANLLRQSFSLTPGYPQHLRWAVPLIEAVIRHGRAESPLILSSHPPAVVLAALRTLRAARFKPASAHPLMTTMALSDLSGGVPQASELRDVTVEALASGELGTASCWWDHLDAAEREQIGFDIEGLGSGPRWSGDLWALAAPGRERFATHARKESSEPEEVRRTNGKRRRPTRIYSPPPEYTPTARGQGIEGVVILAATINRHGNVVKVQILKGLPGGLSAQAAAVVCRWKFNPATLDGAPIPTVFNLTINFTTQ